MSPLDEFPRISVYQISPASMEWEIARFSSTGFGPSDAVAFTRERLRPYAPSMVTFEVRRVYKDREAVVLWASDRIPGEP